MADLTEKACLECQLPICDDKDAQCAWVQIAPAVRPQRAKQGIGRFKKPDPVSAEDVPIEYSGEYRAWIREVRGW